MAERQGFEPWEPMKVQRFSRPPRSTTPAPLQKDEVELNQRARKCYLNFFERAPMPELSNAQASSLSLKL